MVTRTKAIFFLEPVSEWDAAPLYCSKTPAIEQLGSEGCGMYSLVVTHSADIVGASQITVERDTQRNRESRS